VDIKNEDKVKHLEMIQGVISRMAGNSFLLKGWAVLLVSALFALAAKDTQILFIFLAYFPAFTFWILDGYYLRQERLFRALYDKVRAMSEPDIDFSMDTSTVSAGVDSWAGVMFSSTLVIFHGTIVVSIVMIMVIALLIT